MKKIKRCCDIRAYGMLHQTHIAVIRSFFGLAMLGAYSEGDHGDYTSTGFPVASRVARESDRIECPRGGTITCLPENGVGCRYLRHLNNGSAQCRGYRVYTKFRVINNRLFDRPVLTDEYGCMSDPECMTDVCGYGPTDTAQVALLKCLERTSLEFINRSVQCGLYIELRRHTVMW